MHLYVHGMFVCGVRVLVPVFPATVTKWAVSVLSQPPHLAFLYHCPFLRSTEGLPVRGGFFTVESNADISWVLKCIRMHQRMSPEKGVLHLLV